MFLTIKRSNISERLTPLIMPSGCPSRGTALPCPDGCREAMPEAPKSHFLKGGLSACKRYPFGLQKTAFWKAPKTALCNGSSLPPKNAATISAEISDGKKQKQHKPRQHLPAATKRNTAGEKGGSTDEKPRSENIRRKGRKTPQPENKASATPCRTHIIYIAHNAPKTANKR